MAPEDVMAMQTEIEILRKVNHPNIVGLRDVFEDASHYCLIMELMQGGELFDYIIERDTFSEDLAQKIISPLFDAVFYTHDLGVVHRDIKPENLLLDKPELAEATIKISDFGLSRFISAEELATTTCGTPGYVAPEVLSKSPYDYRCDYWSLGVVLFIMLSGVAPFYHENTFTLFEIIAKGQYDFGAPVWADVSDEAKDLIKKLLVVDPNKRLSKEDIRVHPWLTGEFKAPAKELKISLGNMRTWDSQRKMAPKI